MNDAIFAGEWLALFPVMMIGVCIGSLIFLWAERRIITGGILLSFVVRDLLWMAVAVRRLLIIDQSDVLIVFLEFVIVCFFLASTIMVYSENRRRHVLQVSNRLKENYLETLYQQSANPVSDNHIVYQIRNRL